MSRKILGRDAVLGARDIKTEEVYVPEWGGYVRVRALSGEDRDRFERATITRLVPGAMPTLDLSNVRARIVAATVVDEDGNLIFSDNDVVALGKKSAAALERVAKVAQRISGMDPNAVEESAENFPNTPAGDSTSG